MTIKIRNLLEAGHAALAAAKAEREATVKGHPRVGSVGIVAEDGKVYGVCHRKAFARSLGIEEEVGLHTRIMWDAGERHEDGWIKVLEASNSGYQILRHDDAAIKHKLDGVDLEVLGHPDIVLAEDIADPQVITDQTEADLLNGNGLPHYGIGSVVAYTKRTPVLGIEHKGVFSYSTAALVFFENKPKNENLIQAAAYSHFLGVPYELWYTSASYISIPVYDKKKYGSGSIKPFYKGFHMEWRDGYLHYAPENGEWVKTPITTEAIESYYRLVAEMPRVKQLGPRVSSEYLDGKENRWGPGSDCKFCHFSEACNSYEGDQNFDAWVSAISAPAKGGV